MFLVSLALRLLRIAGEALFCFEVNRFLGRAVKGPIRHRLKTIKAAEAQLLSHVRAKTSTLDIRLPSGFIIHTIIASTGGTHNPAVLLHGHSMSAAFFFRNIDDLLNLGYSPMCIPDLPGWGSSTRTRFSGDADDAIAFFLDPFMEWLQVMNLSTFTLVGHSLGAYIAHEYVLRRPKSVRRLVLASPAAVTRHAPLRTALWFAFTPQRLLTHGGLIAHMIFTWRYPSVATYNVNGFRELALCTNSVAHKSGDAAAASMLRFCRVGPAAWRSECVKPLLERVASIACPVDIVTGDKDDLVHVEAVRALYRAMLAVGNNVRLNIIPGADHTPHICAPSKFAKAIMRGLSNVGTGAFQCVNQALGNSMLVT